MMPIGIGKNYEGISNQDLMEKLYQKYPAMEKNTSYHGNGPTVYYSIPGFQGDIGFISAIHGKFCDHCNRIRMNAQGQLKPCLCYGQSIDLREILRREDDCSLKKALERAILEKPQAHCFEKLEEITEEKKMISIGG